MNPKVTNDVVNAETSKAQNLNITNKVKLVQDSPVNKPVVLQASGNSKKEGTKPVVNNESATAESAKSDNVNNANIILLAQASIEKTKKIIQSESSKKNSGVRH